MTPSSPTTLRDELLRRVYADSPTPETTTLLARLWQEARRLAPPAAGTFRGGPGPGGQARSDEDLLRAFLGGDAAAFETLAMRHLGALKGYALRALAGNDADDAVQEAMLVLFRKGNSLDGDGAVRRFVFGALNMEIRRRRSRAARIPNRELPLEDAELVGDTDDRQPDIAFWRDQEVPALADAMLACLDPLDQQILLLWFEGDIEESRAKSIGLILEMNPQTVRVHKLRALKRLREWFAARGGSDG